MEIHEKNLKKIIEYIEHYGAIKDVRIINNSIIVTPPEQNSKVVEVDLNRAKEFEIRFILGNSKEKI